MRGGSDGQRNVHHLTISVRCSGIGGDVLVVDIDITLDEPVVGGNLIITHVLATDVVTVVNDGQRAVYEVARRLPVHLMFTVFSRIVRIVLSCGCPFVQGGQRYVRWILFRTYTVYVLGIDETATHARLHIDEVEFDDTRDVTPVFFPQTRTCTIFSGQLQIDTRCQCHLVMAATVVSRVLVPIFFLPFVESLTIKTRFELCIVHNIRLRRTLILEVYITGQCAEEVHNVIDAEIVAMQRIGSISSRA